MPTEQELQRQQHQEKFARLDLAAFQARHRAEQLEAAADRAAAIGHTDYADEFDDLAEKAHDEAEKLSAEAAEANAAAGNV